ncbi:MAG: response regulator [bacterium]
MLSKRVLVIDDDVCFVRVWEYILTQEGFLVSAVANVREAKLYLKERTPDVILCDVNLPELDDTNFYRYLRTSPRTRNIPVVMLGALGDEKRRTLSKKCGARGFLEKPFSREQLMEVLHKVLQCSNHKSETNNTTLI